MSKQEESGLSLVDTVLLWAAVVLWLALFLIGTLVNSAPYRTRFAAFEGGLGPALHDGLLVVLTYTLTNVALLCILAGLLGALGTKAILHPVGQGNPNRDTTSPRNSAILRSFLVYLALIAGVLLLGDSPAEPTQVQYVRLAGLISLAGFAVNYSPDIFGKILQRAGHLITTSGSGADGQD